MNRRSFFSRLTGAIAGAGTLPRLIAGLPASLAAEPSVTGPVHPLPYVWHSGAILYGYAYTGYCCPSCFEAMPSLCPHHRPRQPPTNH